MNIKNDKPLWLNIIFTAILAITWIWDFFFRSGEKTFRLVLLAVTVWIVYLVYKKSFLRKSEVSYYLIFTFIFAALYLGNVFDFYLIIPMYDKILHSISGLIIGFIGYICFLYLNNGEEKGSFKPQMAMVFSIIFSIAAAGIWEIWEFSTDQLFGFTSQNNSLIDTMMDIICGSVMGIIASIPIYLHSKGKNIRFIDKIIEEINR